jgi:hypothetical protein
VFCSPGAQGQTSAPGIGVSGNKIIATTGGTLGLHTVIMDDIVVGGDQTVYRWTLVGTNTGPGGTGKRVHISGFEEWRIGADGLIAGSRGHFDDADYQRQLEQGDDGAP